MLRAPLTYLSRRRALQRLVTSNGLAFRAAGRFVAGDTLDAAVVAVRDLNARGIEATLDHLGENVTDAREAARATDDYLSAFERIARERLRANVSVKLSQLGLDIDPSLCRANLQDIVKRAGELDNFVRVDMEGSVYTERTIQLVVDLHPHQANVGVVLQAYLYRTAGDVETAIAGRIRVRLCKGAYSEPAGIAYPLKRDTDASFVRLMQRLLDAGFYPAIATHDEAMIRATVSYAHARGIGADRFEFQMLYGIRRDLQASLVQDAWRMRVYVPYGTEWYPYFMRRLAERPANLVFLLRNLWR